MSTQTMPLLNSLARAFEAKELNAFARHFSYPLALYAHDGLLVFGSPATLIEALEDYCNTARDHGVTQLQPRVIAEGIPINERKDIWVEWDHLDAAGTCLRTSQVRFVLRSLPDRPVPVIDLVDYKVAAFPELAEHLPLSMHA